jgi:predicted ribosome-associated RNA-binding protein Tma20
LDRLCGEAVLRGADVFAAGVISASAGITPGTPVIILTDLDMVRITLNIFILYI